MQGGGPQAASMPECHKGPAAAGKSHLTAPARSAVSPSCSPRWLARRLPSYTRCQAPRSSRIHRPDAFRALHSQAWLCAQSLILAKVQRPCAVRQSADLRSTRPRQQPEAGRQLMAHSAQDAKLIVEQLWSHSSSMIVIYAVRTGLVITANMQLRDVSFMLLS